MKTIKDDRGYNQRYEKSKALIIRTARRVDYIISQMTGSGRDVLEIGCGAGEIAAEIAQKTGHNVLGTDLCQPFIDEARAAFKLPNLDFQVLDFNSPEHFGDKKFDYIIGNGILHHLYYNIDQVLVNMKKLLKPGGKIIFLEPNLLNPYCYLIFTFPFFRKLASLEPAEKAFSKNFINRKLLAAGYGKINIAHKDFLLPNTPAFLVKPLIKLGDLLERVFPFYFLAQSIFISAENE